MLRTWRYRHCALSVVAFLLATCVVDPTPAAAQANPFAEIGKLNPFRPKTQIISLPTSSGLWFRNLTQETIFVAIDHHVSGANSVSVGDYNLPVVIPDGWMVIGWFEVPPNKMIQVLSGDLKNRYYYYYAMSKKTAWSGQDEPGAPSKLVHPTQKFSYDSSDPKAVRNLSGKGYVKRAFRKIDTRDATGFTTTFTSNTAGTTKPAPANTAKQKIAMSFRNRTTMRVRFVLNAAPGTTITLEPGQSKTYTVSMKANVKPVVSINQPNGGVLSFTVANGGKYDFNMDGRNIKNFYRK